MNAPCKGCTRPQKCLGCHDRCEDFLEFRREHEEMQEKIRKEKAKQSARHAFITDRQFRNAGKSFNKVWKQHRK